MRRDIQQYLGTGLMTGQDTDEIMIHCDCECNLMRDICDGKILRISSQSKVVDLNCSLRVVYCSTSRSVLFKLKKHCLE